jgi:hypothetical protein
MDGFCVLAQNYTSTFDLVVFAKYTLIKVDPYWATFHLFFSAPHVLLGSHKCESLAAELPVAKEDRSSVYNTVLRRGTLLSVRIVQVHIY